VRPSTPAAGNPTAAVTDAINEGSDQT